MKRFVSLSAAFAGLICMISCSTIKETSMSTTYATEFIGKDYSYITYVCGTPSKIDTDSKGNKVLMYMDMEAFSQKTGLGTGLGSASGEPFVQMFLDDNDKCFNVRTNHVTREKVMDHGKTWLIVGSCLGGTAVLTSVASFITNLLLRRQ